MPIEKPISTIRKAIEGTAEVKADKESIDKPEERHYKAAFNFYRTLRALSPEKVGLIITIAAKSKGLKDEMGVQLFKVFNDVFKDKTTGSEREFNEQIEQIKAKRHLSQRELSKEILKLNEAFIVKKVAEVQNDPRIISAFAGKEELLKKGTEFAMSSTINILEAYEKSPAQLREMTWNDVTEMMARYNRGKPKALELDENLVEKDKLPKRLFSKIINYFRGID